MESKEFKMEYDLATNFDPELIKEVAKIDKEHQIKTVFGKLRKDVVGGGRSSMTLPQLSFRELEDYISLCHKNNLQFNYLMNPACLGNREVNPRFHNKILKQINKLCEAGIDAITVNSPYLCELIKKQFPKLQITIGVAGGVGNCKGIQRWEELGADEITLPHMLNRDFEELKNILEFTKNRKIFVRLIANNVCLHECPYKYSHSSGQSHASQKGSISSDLYIDYNLLSCNNKKIKNPEFIIASEWIRPEDVRHYEELCKSVGNYKFSLKLLDRTKTTDFLVRVADAYIKEDFDGNLIDILCWPTKKNTQVIHKMPLYLRTISERFSIKELLKYEEVFNLPNIYIDNKKLDGFIDKFTNSNQCFSKICGKKENVNDEKSELCFYCLKWADKAISYNKEEVDKWLEKSNDTIDALRTSRFFKRSI